MLILRKGRPLLWRTMAERTKAGPEALSTLASLELQLASSLQWRRKILIVRGGRGGEEGGKRERERERSRGRKRVNETKI